MYTGRQMIYNKTNKIANRPRLNGNGSGLNLVLSKITETAGDGVQSFLNLFEMLNQQKIRLGKDNMRLALTYAMAIAENIVLQSENAHLRQEEEMFRALDLARQRGHSLIFVTYGACPLDKNILDYANLILIKRPGRISTRFERPELKHLMKGAKEAFQELSADDKRFCYSFLALHRRNKKK